MAIYKGNTPIVGWVKFPDYTKGSAIPANTDFTAPSNGWVMGEMSGANGGFCSLKINGVVVQQVGSEGSQRCRGPFSAPVQAGSSIYITVSGNATLVLGIFYPEI